MQRAPQILGLVRQAAGLATPGHDLAPVWASCDYATRAHRIPRVRQASGSTQGATLDHPIVGAYTPVTKSLWKERLRARGTTVPTKGIPPPVDKPPVFTSVSYDFTSNAELLEMYRNPWNRMRIGRVLEDLDSLAGNIAFAHCDDGDVDTQMPLLVTAAVEQIEYLKHISLDRDVQLGGQVVFTGSSSIDIRLALHQAGSEDPNLVALFTFVARDPATRMAARVNALRPQSERERRWFDERQAIAVERKAARRAKSAPPAQHHEVQGAHGADAAAEAAGAMVQEALAARIMPGLASGDAVQMDATRLSNTFTCQPQQRNMHGRVFGGFLMRRAYELAYATAHMFAGQRPRFVVIDRVDFERPVDVGDLVTFESRVIHTRLTPQMGTPCDGPPPVQLVVQVRALVNQPERVQTFATNTFTMIFEVRLTEAGTAGVKRVLPANAQQAALIEPFLRK